nr:hypothetical protein Ade03nite_93360 [Actinoplanes derwentensis]
MWRAALGTAESVGTARTCLLQLAMLGALTTDDLARFTERANRDDEDRILFTARNIAGAGDIATAITMLQEQRSPAARES